MEKIWKLIKGEFKDISRATVRKGSPPTIHCKKQVLRETTRQQTMKKSKGKRINALIYNAKDQSYRPSPSRHKSLPINSRSTSSHSTN